MVDKIKKVVHDFTGAFGFELPTDSNVKENEASLQITKEVETKLGFPGRLLFGSKSHGYDVSIKKKQVYVPNGNVFVKGGYKVWYGDLMSDKITLDALKDLSKKLDTVFYILREHDGRFLSAPPTDKYLEDTFRIKIDKDTVTTQEPK